MLSREVVLVNIEVVSIGYSEHVLLRQTRIYSPAASQIRYRLRSTPTGRNADPRTYHSSGSVADHSHLLWPILHDPQAVSNGEVILRQIESII